MKKFIILYYDILGNISTQIFININSETTIFFVFPAHLCFDIVRRLLILKSAYLNLPSLYSNPNSQLV